MTTDNASQHLLYYITSPLQQCTCKSVNQNVNLYVTSSTRFSEAIERQELLCIMVNVFRLVGKSHQTVNAHKQSCNGKS